MLAYCTIEDVLSVATVFRKDVVPDGSSGSATTYTPNTQTITRQEVDDICFEASDMVRNILRPRYSPAVIDTYDPDFPPVVIYLTKTLASILMYERYSSQSVQMNAELIKSLDRSVKSYKQIITNGALEASDGTPVPTLTNPLFLSGADNDNFPAMEKLKVVYVGGRKY